MTSSPTVGVDAEASTPTPSSTPARPARARRSFSWAWLGLTPFAAYVLLFLALPTVLAVGSGFFTKSGEFTWSNVAALGDPLVLAGFANSAGLSLVTSLVGAIAGALVCYALLGTNPEGALRSSVDAAAGVLAQFGGVMLAFAFIATIGIQGVVTLLLRDTFGIDIFAGGVWLYELPGLVLPYIYFQIPLMVITFMPALSALKPQWAEANLTLGGTRASFWARIGVPVLAPAFIASLLLLFANAFSAFATAAALISQQTVLVPMAIESAIRNENNTGMDSYAQVLALGMVVVVALVMGAHALLLRRAARWTKDAR